MDMLLLVELVVQAVEGVIHIMAVQAQVVKEIMVALVALLVVEEVAVAQVQ